MKLSQDCYLVDTCWKYHNSTKECAEENIYCPRLFRMDYLFEESLMSVKQRQHVPLYPDSDGTDREQFKQLKEIETHIDAFVEQGQNLYIHSANCGNGKTEWSLRMLQAYVNKIWHKSDLRCRVLFVSVPRYLQALKDNIEHPSEYINHVKQNMFDADLVVFDEIGTKAATAFELEHLLNAINTRIDQGKSNIYTSNLSSNELKQKLGTRLYSRIANMSVDIELLGSDKRGLSFEGRG